ncbi:MAG: hypothetical protein K2Y39_05555 [Candidatus Obscuribacterales bacterium]|nr:hypothetical protein [Candidatus Obscuribacterales bacterium]
MIAATANGRNITMDGAFTRAYYIQHLEKQPSLAAQSCFMNAPKNNINCDPEVLADLLTVGMIDNFVAEFTRATSQMNSPQVPEFISQINDCLDAQTVSKKRMKSRLEFTETDDMSPHRIDVVTPCKFVGAGWPSRRTIVI